MKKLCKVIVFPLCLLLILSFAGCSSKTPVTLDTFKTAMADKGYEIVDIGEQYADDEKIKSAHLALDATESYQIEFYELVDENYAKALLNGNKNKFEENKSSVHASSSVNASNHSKYTLSGGGEFVIISQVSNTVIFVHASSDYKDEVKAVLEELGY